MRRGLVSGWLRRRYLLIGHRRRLIGPRLRRWHLPVIHLRRVIGARLRHRHLLVVYGRGLIGARLPGRHLLIVYGRGLIGAHLRRRHLLIICGRRLVAAHLRRRRIVHRRRLVGDDGLPGSVAEHGLDQTAAAAVTGLTRINDLPARIEELTGRRRVGDQKRKGASRDGKRHGGRSTNSLHQWTLYSLHNQTPGERTFTGRTSTGANLDCLVNFFPRGSADAFFAHRSSSYSLF